MSSVLGLLVNVITVTLALRTPRGQNSDPHLEGLTLVWRDTG